MYPYEGHQSQFDEVRHQWIYVQMNHGFFLRSYLSLIMEGLRSSPSRGMHSSTHSGKAKSITESFSPDICSYFKESSI